VNSFSGGDGFYDGVSLIDPVASPGTITDKDSRAGVTFISTLPASSTPGADYNGVTIDLGFGTSQVNGAGGNDLALFFLFEQSSNTIDVTINDITNPISSFDIVENAGGTQQVANGVDWNGGTLDNVLLTVAELELGDFGILSGESINSLSITLTQNDIDPFQVAALSLVGSLQQTAVVPVPAAVWLFGSGLIGLVGIARRKK
jgi:hypothetical protein